MIPPSLRVAALRVGLTGATVGLAVWGLFLVVDPVAAGIVARFSVGLVLISSAVYASIRAARASPGDARAWELMAAGLGAFTLSATAFALDELFGLGTAWSTGAAVCGLLFRLLAALAMLSFPITAATTRTRWRARLKLVAVVSTVAYLAWGWALSSLFHDAQHSTVAARAALFSLLDIVLVIIVLMASLRRPAGLRDSARLVGAGLLFLALTDWNIGTTVSTESARPSTLAAVCSFLALSLVAAGAWLTVHPSGIPRQAIMNARRRDLLPVVLAAIALLATVVTRPEWSADPILLALAIIAATSLLAWQVAVVLENEEMVLSLSEQGERFRTLVETAPIAIIETTPDGRVQVVNSEAARLLDAHPGDLIGLQLDVRPLEPQQGSGALRSRVLDGATLRDVRVPLKRPDGRALDMLVSAAPISNRSGDITSIVWTGSDDGPRLRGLAAMIDVQRMRAFEQLTSGIAHDFNNRLTVILGTTEILLADTTSDADREMLTTVLDAGRRASALVDQLVSTTRRKFDEQERLDLRLLLEQIEPDLRRAAPPGAELVVDLGYATLPVQADWSDLVQAVTNLVVNAYEALPSEGTVTIRARRVAEGDSEARATVELVVADCGHGMEPEVRSRILEPFFTTRPGGGRSRGLGLPAVQGVVLRSHGELAVDSCPGSGTTVTVHLPLQEVDLLIPESAPREPDRRDLGVLATILLVDDEAEVRAVASRVLTSAGHEVIEASDAEGAMAIVTSGRHEIDLLLSDVVMPGRSGIELAHDFVAHHPRRPVLLLSGHVGETADGGRAADVPFPLLAKPLAARDLLAAVAAALTAEPPRPRDQRPSYDDASDA